MNMEQGWVQVGILNTVLNESNAQMCDHNGRNSMSFLNATYDRLARHRWFVLSALTLLLPFVPAVIAWDLNTNPGRHGEDANILSMWTYLHVATFAYLVFLYWKGPPNYLTAYTATFIGHAFFMQELGRPIGIYLASWFNGSYLHLEGGWATGAAAYTHHLLMGVGTFVAAHVVVGITRQSTQPTLTKTVDEGNTDDGH
jgi:hypothetical protein